LYYFFEEGGPAVIFNLIHNASETVGMIGDVMKDLHLPAKDVHLYNGEGLPRDTSDLEGLVVMGGPMNVDDVALFPFLIAELQLIEKVLGENKPVIGICLGAQLVAKALGSRVYPHWVREVGWYPITLTRAASSDFLFKNIPSLIPAFHWHSDTFDLPPNAVHLARSERCENQAFRWGSSTYGLQFHLEVTPAIIQEWCSSKNGQDYIKLAGEDPIEIITSTSSLFRQMQPAARSFFTSYLKSAFSQSFSTA
jgi:GMP synthase (glutamine-hydrolysing)